MIAEEIKRGKKTLTKLSPTEKAYITNGAVTADWIYLGKNDSVVNWSETDELPDEPETLPEEEATEEDYINALRTLGVSE